MIAGKTGLLTSDKYVLEGILIGNAQNILPHSPSQILYFI